MRSIIVIAALGLLCVPSQAEDQISVDTWIVNQIAGTESPKVMGDYVFIVGDAPDIEFRPVSVFKVTASVKNIKASAINLQLQTVPIQTLDMPKEVDGQWVATFLLNAAGKSLVTVSAKGLRGDSIETIELVDLEKKVMIEVPSPVPVGPAPTPVDPPSDELQKLVAPITTALAESPEKAVAVSATYAGFADAIRLVPLSNVSMFQTVNTTAGKMLELPEGVSIGKQIDDALVKHVGIQTSNGKWDGNQSLSESDRQRIAEVYEAVSWAAGESL